MNKPEGRFAESTWAEITETTNEAIILTENEVRKTRTARIMEDKDTTYIQLLNSAIGNPVPDWTDEKEDRRQELGDPVECISKEWHEGRDGEADKRSRQTRRWTSLGRA